MPAGAHGFAAGQAPLNAERKKNLPRKLKDRLSQKTEQAVNEAHWMGNFPGDCFFAETHRRTVASTNRTKAAKQR